VVLTVCRAHCSHSASGVWLLAFLFSPALPKAALVVAVGPALLPLVFHVPRPVGRSVPPTSDTSPARARRLERRALLERGRPSRLEASRRAADREALSFSSMAAGAAAAMVPWERIEGIQFGVLGEEEIASESGRGAGTKGAPAGLGAWELAAAPLRLANRALRR